MPELDVYLRPLRIEDCWTGGNGGALRRSDGEFVINGGIIRNCSAKYGGAYNGNKDPFIMNGGTIDGCIGRSGSGAFNSNNVVIHGGTVKNCVSANGGGVIEISGIFTVDGGTFDNNVAVYGAVMTAESTGDNITVTVTGGTFTNNHLTSGVANIYDWTTVPPASKVIDLSGLGE